MWYNSTNLMEMQGDITRIFEEHMRLHMNICDVIDLSYDDYQLLTNRLRLIKNPEEIQRYTLSIFVAWASSYKFNRENELYDIVRQLVNSMPQHHTKYILEALNTACYDYQIDQYGYEINSILSLRAIMRKHAGF